MPVDARPFLNLTTESGQVIKCGRPRLRPQIAPVSDGPQGLLRANTVCTVNVYVALGQIPADLVENAIVSINVEKERPAQRYRVLRDGISKGAGVWVLYLTEEAPLTQRPA